MITTPTSQPAEIPVEELGRKLQLLDILPELIEARPAMFLAVAEDVPGEYWALENFLAELPMKWELSFAVAVDDRIVAYSVISQKSDTHCHLHHCMVHREFRGLSIGGLMLQEMERRARACHMTRITLKTRSESHDAQRFYVRAGYTLCSDGEAYLTYEKTL